MEPWPSPHPPATPWLKHRTIYMTRHGSHAYGTNLPTSDLDLRGICVAPMDVCLGLKERLEVEVSTNPDLHVFELRKFLQLASDCNPNVIEILFTDPSDHLFKSRLMGLILDHRSMFITKQAKHTFMGYARSQMGRINTHYRWLKNPPKAQPTRKEFGLPERTVIPKDQLEAVQAAIRKEMDSWSFKTWDHLDPATRQGLKNEFEDVVAKVACWSVEDDREERLWRSAAVGVGLDTNFIELLDIERRYTAAMREWRNYNEWKESRNPARAELEAKYGMDTKHAMHLVRLGRMAAEILTEGVVRVRRPDASELLSIRNGAWTYEQLCAWFTTEDQRLNELYTTSTLPVKVDKEKVNHLCVQWAHDCEHHWAWVPC